MEIKSCDMTGTAAKAAPDAIPPSTARRLQPSAPDIKPAGHEGINVTLTEKTGVTGQ